VTRVWSVSWDSVASDGTDWHNALEAVPLAGPKAKRIADLSLHQYDMGFCERLLTEHASKFGGEASSCPMRKSTHSGNNMVYESSLHAARVATTIDS
jgi:hypothetical protein